ncbi:MAG TPA: porin family protein [Xanthobacteraceae bacterium]|jgi:outer membrane immunogenic protein|nr:porin family protein [Xanthobacteraceae bacterium]
MKRILLSGAALFTLIGAAQAADLPRPAPPPPAMLVQVPYTWTGFYVGGAFGYGVWDMNSSVVTPGGVVGTTNNGGRGWVGQAVAGYDYQFAVASFNLVAGVFGDYSFGNMEGTSNFQAANENPNALGGFSASTLTGVEKERDYWDVGARIGWLVTPQILSYFNGGYTEARFDGMTLAPLGGAMSTSSNTYHGWFTGGGVETQIASVPGLFFNTEYRFSSYSSATLPVAGSGGALGTSISLKLQPNVQTVMSGLRYKFNWGP